MKKLLHLVLLFAAFAGTAQAQRRPHRDDRCILRVRLTDGSPIGIIIDGRDYNRTNSSITLGDLPDGRHSLQVYANYSDSRGRRRSKTVYQGTLRLGANTFNAVTIDAGSGSVDIQSRSMDEAAPPPAPLPGTAYRGNGSAATSAFSSSDMENLARQVETHQTDLDKLSTIKAAVGTKKMNTEQVALMLGWLSFDGSRLELAKWMQSRVSDPQNYASLENSFSFDDTKTEFRKTLGSRN